METSELFLNRELSWLAFNERVQFLCIASSNLDEFFMIRVAGLKKQMLSGFPGTSDDGMPPVEQLARIAERTHKMVETLYKLWREQLVPGCESAGSCVVAIAAPSCAWRSQLAPRPSS